MNDVKDIPNDNCDCSLARLLTHAPRKVDESPEGSRLLYDLALRITLDQDWLVTKQAAVIVKENALQRPKRGGASVQFPEQRYRLPTPDGLVWQRLLPLVVAGEEEDDDNLGGAVAQAGDDRLFIAAVAVSCSRASSSQKGR
jgi:hypothetical protein